MKLKGSLWRRKGLAVTFIFLRKLIWVDEVRLPLTEKFQKEIGLPQSNISLSHHFFSTPDFSIGKAQELNTPSPASSCSGFTSHHALNLFAKVKQGLAPTKPSVNQALPGLRVRRSRLPSRHNWIFGCVSSPFRPWLCSKLLLFPGATLPPGIGSPGRNLILSGNIKFANLFPCPASCLVYSWGGAGVGWEGKWWGVV